MDEKTQTELVRLAKLALTSLSCATRRRDNQDLIFSLRDILRKIEGKDGRGRDAGDDADAGEV